MEYSSVPTANGSSLYDSAEASAASSVIAQNHRAKNVLVVFGEVHIDVKHVESVKYRFERLTQDWLRGIGTQSSLQKLVEHPAYQEIITMGDAVVPFILADLVASPKPWFYALWRITGVDPLPRSAAGNLKKMSAAWVKWGRKNGHLPAA